MQDIASLMWLIAYTKAHYFTSQFCCFTKIFNCIFWKLYWKLCIVTPFFLGLLKCNSSLRSPLLRNHHVILLYSYLTFQIHWGNAVWWNFLYLLIKEKIYFIIDNLMFFSAIGAVPSVQNFFEPLLFDCCNIAVNSIIKSWPIICILGSTGKPGNSNILLYYLRINFAGEATEAKPLIYC